FGIRSVQIKTLHSNTSYTLIVVCWQTPLFRSPALTCRKCRSVVVWDPERSDQNATLQHFLHVDLGLISRSGLFAHHVLCNGCASVLNVTRSKSIVPSGAKSRYRYLNVSASRKLCIRSPFSLVTTLRSTV